MLAVPFPGSGRWSAQVLREVAALPCSAAVHFKLEHLIGTLHFHFNSAATVQKEIRHYCQNDPELRLGGHLFQELWEKSPRPVDPGIMRPQ